MKVIAFIENTIVQLMLSAILGLLVALGLNNWQLSNIDFQAGGWGLFFGFLLFQIIENAKTKREILNHIDDRIKRMRLIQDPYVELDSQSIQNFIVRNNQAIKVYSIDRNKPDAWFFNDNYLCFLVLQGARVRNKLKNPSDEYEAHRIFIWGKDHYNDSRHKQLIMLNVYEGICTYLIPIEFLQKQRQEFVDFLSTQGKQFDNKKLDWLFFSEEFLLTETRSGISGLAKEPKDHGIQDRALRFDEVETYKLFFNWMINATKKGNDCISRVNFETLSPDDPNFLDKVEGTIGQVVYSVMKL